MNDDVVVGKEPVVLYVVAVEFSWRGPSGQGSYLSDRCVSTIQFTTRPGKARKPDAVAAAYGEILIRRAWVLWHKGLRGEREYYAAHWSVNATVIRAAE